MPQSIVSQPEKSPAPQSRRRGASIAIKLTVLLLLASVVPLLVTNGLTGRRGQQAIEQTAESNLQILAKVTATQLDQLLTDTARLQHLTSLDDAVIAFCRATTDQRAAFAPAVQRQLEAVVASNPDIASVFVANPAGLGLASTNPKNVGMDLTFRRYMQEAMAGNVYVSEVLVGKTSRKPGIYFSGPVRDTDGSQIGALVIKLRGESVHAICNNASTNSEDGFVGLIDEHGIILAHPDPDNLYKSLRPIPQETQDQIDPQRRYGFDTIISIGGGDVASHVIGQLGMGSVSFTAPTTGEKRILGYAPMSTRAWQALVVVPKREFDQPLRQLAKEQWTTVIIVAGICVLLAGFQSRRLVRPLTELRASAQKIADGDLTAQACVKSRDEIGDLAQTFNQMVPKLKEHQTMHHALKLAMEIQQNLLPEACPAVPGLEVTGINHPADETGGDYYDFLDLSRWHDDTLAVVVGDVTGHGVPAALLMATARAMLRSRATPPGSLNELMTHVNHSLWDDTPSDRFMTMYYMVIEPKLRRVRWVSAGHDPAILYDPATDTFSELPGNDIPLGIEGDWDFSECSHENIAPGSILFTGTDGVWETRNPAGKLFGKDALREVIKAHADRPLEEMRQAILKAVSRFRDAGPQEDDVTIILVRFTETTPSI